MGFDIECIPNIQSLAGEYFCPVCRLLVYPNEALQSQCTHLYCKPCLVYIASTTQACPYDGYLVTEADSKPLSESNKELAETIGKINVNCLYHRSGCTWQGTLVESTKHCSGCAFGNSPVVCNRCAIQILHRQVLEHVQNCPGVQPQAQQAVVSQDAAAAGKITAVDKTQASTQGGTTTTNAQTVQTITSSAPGQDLIQQGNSATHAQASVQAAVPTAEQLHQHQQYQQYYQQYPGYDPYQQQYQQYYPYQQQAVSQYQQAQVFMQPQSSQSQLQPQAQTQAQTQSQPQANNQQHVAAQPLNQPQVNPQQQAQTMVQPQSQIQSSTHLTSHTHPLPLAQPHSQPYPIQTHTPHVQMAPCQQPHLQPQSQSQAHAQLHMQHHPAPQPLTHMHAQPSLHAQHQPLPQPLVSQSKQPMNSNLQSLAQHPSAHSVTGHHYYPQPQSHQQMQLGALQNPLHMQPQGGPQPLSQPPAQMQSRYPQQPPLLRPPQFHNLQQPGLLPSPGQLPNIPPAQQHTNHQSGLLIPQRPVIQQQAMQSGPYIHQQHDVQSRSNPPSVTHAHLQQNVAFPHGQFHQALGPAKRPMGPVQGGEMQPHAQSAVGMQVTPLQVGANKQSGNIIKSDNQVQLPSDQAGSTSRPVSKNQVGKGGEAKEANDLDMPSDVGADVCERRNIKSESDKPMGEAMGLTAPLPAGNGESVKEENTDHTDVSNLDHKQFELPMSDNKELKDGSLLNSPSREAVNLEKQCTKLQEPNLTAHGSGASTPQMRGEGLMQPLHSVRLGRGKHHPPLNHYGPPDLQQRASLVKETPHHPQMPGHPLNQFSPLGPGQLPHLGQHLNLPSEHIQQPMYKQPYGPEIPSGGITCRVTASGPNHFGPPHGPYTEHSAPPSYREMFPDQRLNNTNGRHLEDSGVHLNAMRTPRFRDDRFGPFTDEHLNSFQMDSGQHIIGRPFEDQKHLPRPSYLEGDPGPKLGSQFSSSRPFEWFPRGFGIDGAPRPFDKGAHAQNFNSGLKLDSHGGSGFFPPHLLDRPLHPNDVGERLFGFHDVSRSDSRIHLDFLGKGPGYGHRNMDGFGLPSPDRCYPHITRRFDTLSGIDDIDGRETRWFSDPVGSSYNDIRYLASPGYLQRGGFEGPSNFRMGDHLRTGSMIGPDGIPNHLQRNELLGPHNAPTQLHLGEPGGFIAFSGHDMRELAGPGNFHYPQVGEPGFRSRFSQKGFPGDGGSYTGDMKLVGSSKKRKHSSMGWCRICKVDCETVEGLDLHSQTREHQKMALDMVLAIKQNAKKQKIAPRDQSSVDDDASKPRDSSSEGTGNKD